MLMSDESVIYPKIGEEFSGHLSVNHSANEYARMGGYVHVNTAENFYSILKRGRKLGGNQARMNKQYSGQILAAGAAGRALTAC
jgi:hypothetical protein